MNHEGIVLVTRVGVVLFLVLATAIVRTFIGSSKRRGVIMLSGMLAGMAFGVAVSYLLPPSLEMQESAAFVVGCSLAGWAAAWFFARTIPSKNP